MVETQTEHPAVNLALRRASSFLTSLQQDALQAHSMLTAISSMMGDPRREAMVTSMVEELLEITEALNSQLDTVYVKKAITGDGWLHEAPSEAAK
jgi:hypothetical protein